MALREYTARERTRGHRDTGAGGEGEQGIRNATAIDHGSGVDGDSGALAHRNEHFGQRSMQGSLISGRQVGLDAEVRRIYGNTDEITRDLDVARALLRHDLAQDAVNLIGCGVPAREHCLGAGEFLEDAKLRAEVLHLVMQVRVALALDDARASAQDQHGHLLGPRVRCRIGDLESACAIGDRNDTESLEPRAGVSGKARALLVSRHQDRETLGIECREHLQREVTHDSEAAVDPKFTKSSNKVAGDSGIGHAEIQPETDRLVVTRPVRLKCIRWHAAQSTLLVILEGFLNLGSRAHHERAIGHHRLAQRHAADEEDLEILGTGILLGVGADLDEITIDEHRELTLGDDALLSTDRAAAGEHVGQGIEVRRPRDRDAPTGCDSHVGNGKRGVRDARALMPTNCACQHANVGAAISGSHHHRVIALKILVLRRDALLGTRQVDPQLNTVEKPTGFDESLGRSFDVKDAVTGCHVLSAAVEDDPTTAIGILVKELAVDQVREGLEAAVRMPRSALGLSRAVLDLPHLIHMNKGIELIRGNTGEGAAHRESLALEGARATGYREN